MTYTKKKIRILITAFISPSTRNAVTIKKNSAAQLQAINEQIPKEHKYCFFVENTINTSV